MNPLALTSVVLIVWLALGGCVGTCVVEGTRVSTPAGPRAIETLRVGDAIWCVDEVGQPAVGHVAAVMKGRAHQIVELTLSDAQTLGLTAGHPVLTGQGWRPDGGLHANQSLPGIAAPGSAVPRIETLKLSRGRWNVYNLSVHPHENFVASGAVLHNKTVVPPAPKDWLGRWWFAETAQGLIAVQLNADQTASMVTIAEDDGRHTIYEQGRWHWEPPSADPCHVPGFILTAREPGEPEPITFRGHGPPRYGRMTLERQDAPGRLLKLYVDTWTTLVERFPTPPDAVNPPLQ